MQQNDNENVTNLRLFHLNIIELLKIDWLLN